jgi:hypothetical protein
MSYVSLMVHVDADSELSGRVSIAADLADRFHAHLIGIAGWAPMSVFLAEEALSIFSISKESSFALLSARKVARRNGDPSWIFRPKRWRAKPEQPI